MTFYRRHLPHWQYPGQDLFITWRLFGSLPAKFRPPTKAETQRPADSVLFRSGAGPRAHRARLVQRTNRGRKPHSADCATLIWKEGFSRLRACVLHGQPRTHSGPATLAPLSKITHQIKGATAYRANRILSRIHQRFWQDESFDHWVRNAAEGEKIRQYIENNPVVGGLVARPEDRPWSSASRPIV